MKSCTVADDQCFSRNIAEKAIVVINRVLSKQTHCVVVPSAGRTLVETFAILNAEYRDAVDWSRVICVQMDEYEGISCDDSASFAHQIQMQFVEPLGIGQFLRFFDQQGNLVNDLDEHEARIKALGGIDCAIHGVGVNGHIGFNEPAEQYCGGTRYAALAEATVSANQTRYDAGVTLGLDILIEAKTSIVAMRGKAKTYAANAVLSLEEGPGNPVAYLRRCENLFVFLDEDCAGERARRFVA